MEIKIFLYISVGAGILNYHLYSSHFQMIVGKKPVIGSCIWCTMTTHIQFSSVQSLSRVRLFVTPWIAACQALAPHSSTLAWKIPWTEEPGRLQSMGSRSWTQLSDFTFTFHFHALEKEMATHSCSCLENPKDRGAWWAAVYGVTQSRTCLKWLSSSSRTAARQASLSITNSQSPPKPLSI